MIFDQSGSLAGVSRHDYLPFGEELFAGTGGRTTTQGYSATDGVRQKFTQKERDNETGLDYFLARYYASTQGRFTTPDPLLASGTIYDPQTWNRYAYTLNNPLRFVDPTGLYVFSEALGGSLTNDELLAGTKTDEERKRVKHIIDQRNQFKDALAAARAAANDPGLTGAQRAKVLRAVNSYGDFHDGKTDNVVVGFVAKGSEAPTTALGTKDGNIHVDLNLDQADRNPIITVGHEGSHVADFQEYIANRGDPGLTAAYDIEAFFTEDRAYTVSSYLAQALGEKSYYPNANKDSQLWNKGWKENERESKRALGIIRTNPWQAAVESGGLIRPNFGPKISTQTNSRY
jgi:RHS repeat-associated protein